MPLIRPKWSDLSPEDQRSLQDEGSWDMYWDEKDDVAKTLKKELTKEQFAEWVRDLGAKWSDD